MSPRAGGCRKGVTLVEDAAVVPDEANDAGVVGEAGVPDQRAVPEHPRRRRRRRHASRCLLLSSPSGGIEGGWRAGGGRAGESLPRWLVVVAIGDFGRWWNVTSGSK
jgi:hypothetical protein